MSREERRVVGDPFARLTRAGGPPATAPGCLRNPALTRSARRRYSLFDSEKPSGRPSSKPTSASAVQNGAFVASHLRQPRGGEADQQQHAREAPRARPRSLLPPRSPISSQEQSRLHANSSANACTVVSLLVAPAPDRGAARPGRRRRRDRRPEIRPAGRSANRPAHRARRRHAVRNRLAEHRQRRQRDRPAAVAHGGDRDLVVEKGRGQDERQHRLQPRRSRETPCAAASPREVSAPIAIAATAKATPPAQTELWKPAAATTARVNTSTGSRRCCNCAIR